MSWLLVKDVTTLIALMLVILLLRLMLWMPLESQFLLLLSLLDLNRWPLVLRVYHVLAVIES